MSAWNFDISAAPRGRYVDTVMTNKKGEPYTVTRFVPDRVILATKCGKRTLSMWLPPDKSRKSGRWQMLNDDEEPVAWFPWPDYPELAP